MRRAIIFFAVLLSAAGLLAQSTRRVPTPDEQRAKQHHAAGRKLMREEHWEEAISEFKQAARFDPDLLMVHYDLGQSYMAVKEFDRAVEAYEACRKVYLKTAADLVANTLEAQAARQDRARELRGRIRELQEIPAPPNSMQAIQIQNDIARLENMASELEQLQGKNLESVEVPAELSLAIGSACFRNGKLADAEREYRAALAARPKFGQVHNNLAVVCLMLGRPAEAKEQVKLAEKAGFRVHPDLKKDIDKAIKALPN